jgi:hypothetical protein
MDKNDKIIFRFLMLLIPTLFLSIWYFQNIGGLLNLDLEVNKTGKEQVIDVTNEIQKQFKNKIKDIEKLLNIPNTILGYKIYAQNNVYATTKDKKFKDSFMRIDVNGQYEEIKTKHIKIFRNTLTTPEEITKIPIEVSFIFYDQRQLEIIGDKYKIGIEPTILSWAVVLFSTCLVTHLFWFIMYKWYRFVQYGSF